MIYIGKVISINENKCKVIVDGMPSGECSFCRHTDMIDVAIGGNVLVFFQTGFENGYILGVI